MKRLLLIWCLVLVALLPLRAQWPDCTASLIGTSRYVGMAGAMAAVGGDVSAVPDNPAALGVFRRSEAGLTFAVNNHRMWVEDYRTSSSRALLSELHWNFLLRYHDRLTGVVANNLCLYYHRDQLFHQEAEFTLTGAPHDRFPGDASDKPFPSQYSSRGYLDHYALAWGMNIAHRVYLGADFALLNLYSTENKEEWGGNAGGSSSMKRSGLGCRLSLGAIYHPLSWLRMGASIVSPSPLRLTEDGQSRTLYLPMKMVGGVAFQLHDRGLLSFQCDYWQPIREGYLSGQSQLMLRVGGEYVVRRHLFLNAGYAYHFSGLHYATAGLSGRWKSFVLGASYQCRIEQACQLPAYSSFAGLSARSLTHQIVFTLSYLRPA